MRQLAGVLEREGIKYESDREPSLRLPSLKRAAREQIFDAYDTLGGLKQSEIASISTLNYPLIVERQLLFGFAELSYNRYKAALLRLPFYAGISGFSADTHLRYCRQFEHNCLKAGIRDGVWSSLAAERHFGKSSEPGDFFGNGSAGWKLAAFKELARDVLAIAEGFSPVYFSLYDQLMVNGKLIGFGDLLKAPGSEQYQAVAKYLRRRLNLPAPAAE